MSAKRVVTLREITPHLSCDISVHNCFFCCSDTVFKDGTLVLIAPALDHCFISFFLFGIKTSLYLIVIFQV